MKALCRASARSAKAHAQKTFPRLNHFRQHFGFVAAARNRCFLHGKEIADRYVAQILILRVIPLFKEPLVFQVFWNMIGAMYQLFFVANISLFGACFTPSLAKNAIAWWRKRGSEDRIFLPR